MDELLDEERKASLKQTGRHPPHGETRAGMHRHTEQKTAEQRHRSGKHAAAKNGQKANKKRISPLLRFLIKLAAVAAILIAVFTFVLGVHIHHGNRMYPFIMDGDLLITYKLDPYRVGDAVAYRNPKTGETGISRIVAIGENEIEITEIGEMLINGYVPSESVFYPTRELEGSEVSFPYKMGANGYFLLDDQRENGSDSRAFGELTEDNLLGKVVYVFRRRGI